MRALFILLLLCCHQCRPAYAQAADTVYGYAYLHQLRTDTLTTQPDATAWRQLTGHKEYVAYKDQIEFRDVEKENRNLNRGVGFLAKIFRFFSTAAGKLILFSLFVLLGAYFLYRWLGQRSGSLFYSSKKFHEGAENPNDAEDLIQDWESAMQQARQKQDYRMAIRFGYLWLLQLLHEKQWIAYHPNKTNRDYAHALQEPATRDVFLKLSRIYERTWYGYQPALPADFNTFEQQFEILKNKVAA